MFTKSCHVMAGFISRETLWLISPHIWFFFVRSFNFHEWTSSPLLPTNYVPSPRHLKHLSKASDGFVQLRDNHSLEGILARYFTIRTTETQQIVVFVISEGLKSSRVVYMRLLENSEGRKHEEPKALRKMVAAYECWASSKMIKKQSIFCIL